MPVFCEYCIKISKFSNNYPVQEAVVISDVYQNRCYKHWQYICDVCKKAHHFSGIGWCATDNTMICLKCAKNARISRESFWNNSYYYQMLSNNNEWVNALDRLEFEGKHPLDLGIKVKIAPLPQLKPTDIPNYNKRQNVDIPSENEISNYWTKNALSWNEDYTDDGDPQRQSMLPVEHLVSHLGKVNRILDAGCGAGYLCRQLAKRGFDVVGVDNSEGQLQLAKEITLESNLPECSKIRYVESNLTNLQALYNEPLFDGIVCTTVLENIEKYDLALMELGKIIRRGGRIVITIIHPCFSMKDLVPRKIPVDGVRIEDIRCWEMDNYFSRGVSLVKYSSLPAPTISFHRTLEDYSQALYQSKFAILKLIEPCPTLQQIDTYPLLLKNRSDRIPRFLTIVAEKWE